MTDSIKPTLYVGQSFSSKEEFELCLKTWMKGKKQHFTTRSSKLLKAEEQNSNNQHYELIYECVFAGNYIQKRPETARKSR